jgi:hypothetical protein
MPVIKLSGIALSPSESACQSSSPSRYFQEDLFRNRMHILCIILNAQKCDNMATIMCHGEFVACKNYRVLPVAFASSIGHGDHDAL